MKKIKFFFAAEILSFLCLSINYGYYGYQTFYANNPLLESDLFSKIMVCFSLLIIVFGICHLCSAIGIFRKLEDPDTIKAVWKITVLMKMVFIPMFLLNFLFGLIFGLFAMFFVVTIPYVVLQVAVAWFAMMSSSGYCIILIIYAKKRGVINSQTAIGQILLQLIYVLDIIGLLSVRKMVRSLSQIEMQQ